MDEEPESLEDRFQLAAERMRQNTALSLSNEQKLQLYGYFKQAKEGPCSAVKPGFFDFTGRAKWDAWKRLGDVPKEEAMQQYIGLVSSVDPDWQTTKLDPSQLPPKPSSGGMSGPSVSRLAEEVEEVLPDDQKSVFDWCKEGNATRLAAMVTEKNINKKDEQGMALLHWACDRGHMDVVKLLVSKGADINIQDSDQQTPLHYASSCDQKVVALCLLSAGADASIKDCDGATAVEVANSPSTKELFPHHT